MRCSESAAGNILRRAAVESRILEPVGCGGVSACRGNKGYSQPGVHAVQGEASVCENCPTLCACVHVCMIRSEEAAEEHCVAVGVKLVLTGPLPVLLDFLPQKSHRQAGSAVVHCCTLSLS